MAKLPEGFAIDQVAHRRAFRAVARVHGVDVKYPQFPSGALWDVACVLLCVLPGFVLVGVAVLLKWWGRMAVRSSVRLSLTIESRASRDAVNVIEWPIVVLSADAPERGWDFVLHGDFCAKEVGCPPS